jgi:uncharacterized OB-fold protein
MERPFNEFSYGIFLDEGKLMGVQCQVCGALYLPPRPFCVHCYKDTLNWKELGHEGNLCAFTSIFVVPKSMAEQGFGRDNPYIVGVVELKDGVRIVGRIEGVDAKKPEAIRIGMPLKAIFLKAMEAGGPKTYLAFQPA